MTSPTSETPEPIAMETEAETPAPQPGEDSPWRGGGGVKGQTAALKTCSGSAEVKPEPVVDNWEKFASDEEKGKKAENSISEVKYGVRLVSK